MSEEEQEREEVYKTIVAKLVEELRNAYHRTPVTSSSWIHVRNAYMLAQSLERLVYDRGRKNKIPPQTLKTG